MLDLETLFDEVYDGFSLLIIIFEELLVNGFVVHLVEYLVPCITWEWYPPNKHLK